MSSPLTPGIHIPTIKLSDGNSMPVLGFGTSSVMGNDSNDPGFRAIVHAIKFGYRFIDTATIYKNEQIVGQAINHCIDEGLVRREELFVCTKVWSTYHKRASVLESCRESLRRLNLTYLDLFLVHWPMAFQEGADSYTPLNPTTGELLYSDTHYTETWLGMEDVKEAGLSRSIGVSNFNSQMTDQLLAGCKHKPAVNQVECHPYLNQAKLHQYSRRQGITLNAYCPLGSPFSCAKPGQPMVLEDPVVVELARKYARTGAQILIRFLVQRTIPAIPKSVTLARIEENASVFDFQLDQADMERLMGLDRKLRYCLETAGYQCHDHPLYPFHADY